MKNMGLIIALCFILCCTIGMVVVSSIMLYQELKPKVEPESKTENNICGPVSLPDAFSQVTHTVNELFIKDDIVYLEVSISGISNSSANYFIKIPYPSYGRQSYSVVIIDNSYPEPGLVTIEDGGELALIQPWIGKFTPSGMKGMHKQIIRYKRYPESY